MALRELFAELRHLKQVDLVEAEGIRDPIKRAYALVLVRERIERVERRIERRMKGMRVPNVPRVSMEIRQGLMACADYKNCTDCPYDCEEEGCMRALNADALALIRQLERQNAEQAARLEQVTRERDAAVADLKAIESTDGDLNFCEYCRYGTGEKCKNPQQCNPYDGKSGWEWRGVPQEVEHE